MNHGTSRAYKVHECRCDECRRGNRERRAVERARARSLVRRAPDTGWQVFAACRDMPQEGVFFAATAPYNRDAEAKLPGLAVCATCPVTGECLEYALALNVEVGIFGGYTSAQRRRLQRSPTN